MRYDERVDNKESERQMSILLVDSIRLGNKVKQDIMCIGEKIYHRGWDKKEQKLYCYEVDEKGNRID